MKIRIFDNCAKIIWFLMTNDGKDCIVYYSLNWILLKGPKLTVQTGLLCFYSFFIGASKVYCYQIFAILPTHSFWLQNFSVFSHKKSGIISMYAVFQLHNCCHYLVNRFEYKVLEVLRSIHSTYFIENFTSHLLLSFCHKIIWAIQSKIRANEDAGMLNL